MKKIIEDLIYKDLSFKIHGAAIEVRRDFGAGHKEKLYQQALAAELDRRGIKFEREKAIKIYSPKDGKFVGLYRPDFVVENKIIVETKVETFVRQDEIKRIYDYLRNSEYELAYLVNFASPQLYVRRIVYTNKYKSKIGMKIAILFLASIGLLLADISGVRAASQSLYFSAPSGTIAVGSEFPVKILIDSDQPLNAYVVTFSYDPGVLTIVGFDNGKSIIDVWQGQPAVSENGSVGLRGGSVTPFSGKGGNIITVNFRAVGEGEPMLAFGNSSFYMANGKGTKVVPQTADLKFQILSAGAVTSTLPVYEEASDIAPPTIKYLSLVQDPFNSGQKLLSFMVSDPDSGIRETLVRTRSLLLWSDWIPAQNPTAIPLSAWSIGFRAIDNRGNISERTLYNFSAFLRPEALGVAALFIIFLVIIGFIIVKIKKGRSVS